MATQRLVIDLFRPVARPERWNPITEDVCHPSWFDHLMTAEPSNERGFLILTRPSLKTGAEGVRLIVDRVLQVFTHCSSDPTGQKSYFYPDPIRSNEEGISLGNKETFVTPEQGSEPTWIESTTDYRQDWWIGSWLSSFYQKSKQLGLA